MNGDKKKGDKGCNQDETGIERDETKVETAEQIRKIFQRVVPALKDRVFIEPCRPERWEDTLFEFQYPVWKWEEILGRVNESTWFLFGFQWNPLDFIMESVGSVGDLVDGHYSDPSTKWLKQRRNFWTDSYRDEMRRMRQPLKNRMQAKKQVAKS